MYLLITGDTDEESGVGEIIDSVSGPTTEHFAIEDYGVGSIDIVIVLMCQDPALNLKRRVRLSKKDNTLYMDIMLDLPTMKGAIPKKRQQLVFKKIHDDLKESIARYRLPNFETERFLRDLKSWLDGSPK
jgi:hypothetical protein